MSKPCDNCGRRRKLAPYTLSAGPRTVVLALCSECAAPLLALMEHGHANPPESVKVTLARPVGHAIVPVD